MNEKLVVVSLVGVVGAGSFFALGQSMEHVIAEPAAATHASHLALGQDFDQGDFVATNQTQPRLTSATHAAAIAALVKGVDKVASLAADLRNGARTPTFTDEAGNYFRFLHGGGQTTLEASVNGRRVTFPANDQTLRMAALADVPNARLRLEQKRLVFSYDDGVLYDGVEKVVHVAHIDGKFDEYTYLNSKLSQSRSTSHFDANGDVLHQKFERYGSLTAADEPRIRLETGPVTNGPGGLYLRTDGGTAKVGHGRHPGEKLFAFDYQNTPILHKPTKFFEGLAEAFPIPSFKRFVRETVHESGVDTIKRWLKTASHVEVFPDRMRISTNGKLFELKADGSVTRVSLQHLYTPGWAGDSP